MWAAGFVEHTVLLLVLLALRRYRTFPFFTLLIGFNVLRTVVLFLVFRSGSHQVYADVYWSAAVLDVILQVLVVLEILRVVVRPAGAWGDDVRRRFSALAGAGIILAVGLTFAIDPHLPHGRKDWIELGQLLAISLFLLLFIAMRLATTILGIVGRRHAQALAAGWGIWALVAFLVEGAYSYFGPKWHGMALDDVRIVVYQLVTIFWAWSLWTPEPKQGTLCAEQKERIFSVQKQAEDQLKVLGKNR